MKRWKLTVFVLLVSVLFTFSACKFSESKRKEDSGRTTPTPAVSEESNITQIPSLQIRLKSPLLPKTG